MAAAIAARSIFRSGRAGASTFASRLKPNSPPRPFRLPTLKPPCHRILRTPVEMSFALESMLPYHTATASALLTSMLSVSPRTFAWTPQVQYSTTTLRRYILITFVVAAGVPIQEEALSIFSKLQQGLFREFQTRHLILSKEKGEGGGDPCRKVFAGLWCEKASKHTFRAEIRKVFSASTIDNIEAKKGLGAWCFALVGADKEVIRSFGHESLPYLQEAAGAFQQRRAFQPVFSNKVSAPDKPKAEDKPQAEAPDHT